MSQPSLTVTKSAPIILRGNLHSTTCAAQTPAMKFHVRPAIAADAEAMLRAHDAAVHQSAGTHYPREILDAWGAKLTEENLQRLMREIGDDEMIVVVAEAESQVVGFGTVVAGNEELRAVYVHPDYGRRGIGSAILKRLEALAVERGVEQLELDSSLNAEAFYAAHGYELVERTVHRLRSGHEMACVKMRKTLTRFKDGAD